MAKTSQPAKPAENTETAVTTTRDAVSYVDRLIVERSGELLALLANDPASLDRLRSLTAHALADEKLRTKLLKADLATVYLAVRECASLGLMPIPTLAEAYFVPYWNRDKQKYDVELQPGYAGLTKLVRNSGRVLDVGAGVAYERDEFDYDEGSAAFVRHKRALKDRGDRIAAYAIAWLPGDVVRVRVMDMAEIETHRMASKADGGPWIDWYDAMATKTVLRDLCKQLPKSAKVEQALMLEAEAEDRGSRPAAAPGRPPAGVQRIQARLGLPVQSESLDAPDDGSGLPPAEPSSATEPKRVGEPDLSAVQDDPDLQAGLDLLNPPSNAGVHL